MLSANSLLEFETQWLPHVTEPGLNRLIELLESGSPLLIHGAFTRACPMGCLATHIAWHHPATRNANSEEAGVLWLTRIAGLNPATSSVILEWDRIGAADWHLRSGLVEACRREAAARNEEPPVDVEALCELQTC